MHLSDKVSSNDFSVIITVMINIIKGKKIVQVDSLDNIPEYAYTVVDLGCGDGKQIYEIARNNPSYFCIGIDPNFKGLEDISKKTYKKPEKGGLNNLLFIHSGVETLPSELGGIANEIQINFPWGSLLQGVVLAEESVLKNIISLAKNDARFLLYTTYNDKFEEQYRKERELPELTLDYIETQMKTSFLEHGIKLTEARLLDDDEKTSLTSTWAKKILATRNRDVFLIQGIIYKA